MTEVVRKGGLAMKIAKKDLHVNPDIKIEEFLRKDPDNAYTINGILVEVFGVDPKNLRGPWSNWPGNLPTLYGRVRRVLDRLHLAGKVTKGKQGKAVFWGWNGD